jgi:isopentenyldiphosphate isomerase
MEHIDILDNKGDKTREIATYDEVHETGLIHRAVHVWILNFKNEILLQKREKKRRAYPNYYDISISGHVSAGQTSLEAAQCEAEEELGLKISESQFLYLFTLEEHLVLNNRTYINNEFQDVYLVRKDIDLSQISFNDGEVEEVKFLSLDQFEKWTNGEGELLVPHKEEYRRLLEYINYSMF